MNRRSVVQVAGAFVASVVLTLGSLVYSSKRETTELRKAAIATASVENSTSAEFPEIVRPGDESNSILDARRRARDVRRSAERAGMLPQLMRHAGSPEVPEPEVQEPDPSDPFTSHSNLVNQARLQKAPNGRTPEFLTMAAPTPSEDVIGSLGSSPDIGEAVPIQPEAKPQIMQVTLATGTRLTVNLGAALSSDQNSMGDTFGGTLTSRVTVNGVMLADKGAPVIGRVVKVKKAHLLHPASDLGLMLIQITAKDGQPVKIETGLWEEKNAHNRLEEAPKIAVGAFRGAFNEMAKGAGFASDNGNSGTGGKVAANKRAVVLAAGTPINFYLARPITVSARVN